MDASAAQTEGGTEESSGRRRFRQAATTVAHLCGLVLSRKSYMERSPTVQWAVFNLKRQMNLRSDLLFNLSDYSKKQFQKKGFEKLKHLLHICPKQRQQQDLLQIQACLKTNRGFHGLPSKTQLQLCQAFIYQEYEAGTIIIKQGHVATECYLVLSGKLKVVREDVNFKVKSFTSEALYEAEEGDFIGETCLLTKTKRLASVVCKSNAELLMIEKENFKYILADLRSEQHHATCTFLRKLPIFSTWPPEKIDFLVHCSLQRFYRAGTAVVTESLNSYFLVVVKSGRCVEAARLSQEMIIPQDGDCSGLFNTFSQMSLSKQKMNFTGKVLDNKRLTQDSALITATCKAIPEYESEKQRPQTAAATYCSPAGRRAFSDLKERGLFGDDDDRIKRTHKRKKVASLAPRFLKIRTLEQSDIFGLAEIMDQLCALQLSLISEGAECIFIPKKLFLENAPAKSRRIALEMVSSFPTENMIQESYIMQQAWTTYKTALVREHLERHARPISASISSWSL